MAQRDPHEVLGIDRDASQATVKAAWRRLAREHHPDLAADSSERRDATRRMAEINAAYQALRSRATGGAAPPAADAAGHSPARYHGPLPAAQRHDDAGRRRLPTPTAGTGRAPASNLGRGGRAAGLRPDRSAAARPFPARVPEATAGDRRGPCDPDRVRQVPRAHARRDRRAGA